MGWRAAVALVVFLQAFASTSGSRMAWLYAAAMALLGMACWWRSRETPARRFAAALAALVIVYGTVAVVVASSGVLDRIGGQSAEQRVANGEGEESNSQRLWFWRVGVDAALDHPILGVGAGRFAGAGLDAAMRSQVIPGRAADAQAHNIFVQLAAECGIPLALAAAAALALWLVRAWRATSRSTDAMAIIALTLPILIHANLEHPLGYLYFLGLLGLLFGQLGSEPVAAAPGSAPERSTELLRYASFAILALAAIAYVQFAQVERAMQALVAQVRAGAPPQPTRELGERLAAVPRWSVFGDYAELIELIASVPTASNAAALAPRCERSIAFGPSPQLLARCATILQVAGQAERASYLANSLCKLYPTAAPVLIQSMTFVESTSPSVADLRSTCVERAR